jgi:hypothetical protein
MNGMEVARVLTDAITTAATPNWRSQSPSVLPIGAPMSWQPAVPSYGDRSGSFALASRTRSHDPKLMIDGTATVDADARVTAKQDRPPRGVPR